jgi:hypothetical protein
MELLRSLLMSSNESPSLKNSKLLRAVLKISSVSDDPLVFNGDSSPPLLNLYPLLLFVVVPNPDIVLLFNDVEFSFCLLL